MGLKIKVFYGADMAGLLNISTENRKMAEDFREKMIINARKNVPLQHVPYFDVQNTDERPSFVKHFYSGFLLFSLNNFNFLHQDFMFQLTDEEYENLRCKNSTSSWGGRRYNPYTFIVSLQKNAMKLKSSAVIWQGVKIRRQHAIFCLFSVLSSCLPR